MIGTARQVVSPDSPTRVALAAPSSTESLAVLTSLPRAAALAVAAALPLAVWPWSDRPFSTAKLWVLLAGSAVVLLIAAVSSLATARSRPGPRGPQVAWLPVAWLGSWLASALASDAASPEQLWLALAGPLWFAALWAARVSAAPLATAHVAGVTGCALVALAQAAGADPFALAGWSPVLAAEASARLRVFGTLGNPNFVAALLAPTVVLALGLARAAPAPWHAAGWALSAAVQSLALVATGSRAGAAALAVAGLAFVGLAHAVPSRRDRWLGAAGALGLAAAIVVFSGARPLGDTVAGRVYIWRVAAPQVAAHPWLGHGPGAFELGYPGWEDRAWRDGRVGATSAGFRGPQPHAHNDYLEALVDRGLVGLVTIVLLLATPLRNALWLRRRTRGDPVLVAASAAAVALAAIALVDFPLARPAEQGLAWMLAAMALAHRRRDEPEAGP